MTASMTAFSSFEDSGAWGQLSWELRTVNHRYLEIAVRLPEELRTLEHSVREHIAARLGRGRVDCVLRYAPNEQGERQLTINKTLAKQVIKAAESLPIGESSALNPVDVLRWPGVIEKTALDPARLSQPLFSSLNAALELLLAARRQEGEKLRAMLLTRCTAAEARVDQLRERLPAILQGLRERYLQGLSRLNVEVSSERFEQEIALLAQKMDVAEELERLQAHSDAIRQLFTQDKPIGRHLDFLLQEMHREANTLGAKAAHVDLGQAAVELKVLIEQMREQAQNIE